MAACFPCSGVKPFPSPPKPRVSSFPLYILSVLSYASPLSLPSSYFFARVYVNGSEPYELAWLKWEAESFLPFRGVYKRILIIAWSIKGRSLWEWVFRCGTRWKLQGVPGHSGSAEIMEQHPWNLELCSKSSREWIEAITWREREDCYQDYRTSWGAGLF